MNTVWDKVYADGRQITRWPWTDLVSLCKRHLPSMAGKRVLELGCGSGANIPFFDAEGCEYYGVESADVGNTHALGRVIKADFTQGAWNGPKVDLVFDRASVVHNDVAGIERAMDLAFGALKPGGLYIGVDWFSTAHEDKAQFEGIPVTLCSAHSMREYFKRFEILSLEHKIVERLWPSRPAFASWNIVARGPG